MLCRLNRLLNNWEKAGREDSCGGSPSPQTPDGLSFAAEGFLDWAYRFSGPNDSETLLQRKSRINDYLACPQLRLRVRSAASPAPCYLRKE